MKWTDYYLNKLPKNGMCMLTGQPDYIPKSYPVVKRNSKDLARLIIAEPSQDINKLLWDKDFLIGYTASQKILHTLQALLEDDKSYLDNEVEFLNTIYNIEDWKNNYDPYTGSPILFSPDYHADILNAEEGQKKFNEIFTKYAMKNKKTILKHIFQYILI